MLNPLDISGEPSIQLENCGKVEKQTTGLQATAATGLSESGAKPTK